MLLTTRLYVGNLPFTATEETVLALFEEFALPVGRARLVRDQETGVSKGFCFVDMADVGAAQDAINALNGVEIGGRVVSIESARPDPRFQASASGSAVGTRNRGGRASRERRW